MEQRTATVIIPGSKRWYLSSLFSIGWRAKNYIETQFYFDTQQLNLPHFFFLPKLISLYFLLPSTGPSFLVTIQFSYCYFHRLLVKMN